jgi:DNA-binding transcriptional LysR family regulator
MPYPFDIEELKTFVLLAENGHFTATARILGISQPAVSQRIAKLESAFGLSLFTRSAERAVLTPCGEKVLPASKRCVEKHLALAARLKSGAAIFHEQRVRIWIDYPTLGRRLASLLKLEVASDLQLEQVAPPSHWQEGLRTGEVDLIFSGGFLPGPCAWGLSQVQAHHEPGISVFWCPNKFDFEEPFTLEALTDRPVWTMAEEIVPGFRAFIDDWCRRIYGKPLTNLQSCSSFQELFSGCEAGHGIGLVPGDAGSRYALVSERMAIRTLFGGSLPEAYAYRFYFRAGEPGGTLARVIERLTPVVGSAFKGGVEKEHGKTVGVIL